MNDAQSALAGIFGIVAFVLLVVVVVAGLLMPLYIISINSHVKEICVHLAALRKSLQPAPQPAVTTESVEPAPPITRRGPDDGLSILR